MDPLVLGELTSPPQFRTAFRGHHIPTGMMACKLHKFLHLQLGLSSVYEYS
jgi:hypothetical protein